MEVTTKELEDQVEQLRAESSGLQSTLSNESETLHMQLHSAKNSLQDSEKRLSDQYEEH